MLLFAILICLNYPHTLNNIYEFYSFTSAKEEMEKRNTEQYKKADWDGSLFESLQ